jgi:hypothetical protein
VQSHAGKEKGIDVQLAVDPAIGAAVDDYDEAAIMTGDSDLLYAVQTGRRFGKKVHLMALGSRFPRGISFFAEKKFIYDIGHFFRQKIQPSYKGKSRAIAVRELTESGIRVQSV